MIETSVTIDDQSGVLGMLSGIREQIPFAASLGINNTLKEIQTGIRATLPEHFILRHKSFIEQSVLIAREDFATKDNLAGTVRINPSRDFLAKFEAGGEKTASSARGVAVPIIRATDKTRIFQRGDPLSVAMLLDAIQQRSGRVLHARVRKGIVRVTRDAQRVFLITSAKGSFIVQRTGPQTTRVLWAFERHTPLPASLHFEDTAMRIANARLETNLRAALDRAIETMR